MRRLNFRSMLGRVLILGLLSFGSLAFAQVSATMTGSATDPSGASVPNVKVNIINEGTGVVVRAVVTNSAGIYSAPNLAIGHYTLRANAPGFKSYDRTGIVLNVNSTVLANIPLVVGSTTQNVTVQANPIQVQSETNELSTLITGTQIDEIAINGRNPFQLASLVPGSSNSVVQFQSPEASGSGGNAITYNGERLQQNDYLIDGGEVYDRGCGGCYEIEPSPDAVAEFKIITSNAAGNIGMASGGIVSLSLKSGTSHFHGGVWEYNRNDAFDANNYLAKRSHTQKPELRYNIFGFNIAGPVVIPRVYGDEPKKTFFFYNMEWRRLIEGGEILSNAIPSAAFSGNFGSANITVPQTSDPAARARFASYGLTPGEKFPNNQIPAGLIDPNVALLLKAGIFPAPNTPDGLHFSSAAPATTNVREEIGRIDHQFNDKISLHGSVAYDSGFEQALPPQNSIGSYSNVGSTFTIPSYVTVVSLTDAITSNLLNEVWFSFNGNKQNIVPFGLYVQPDGYNVQPYFPGANADNRIPTISLGKPYSVNYDVGSTEPWSNSYGAWEYKDNLSWVLGKHSIMLGGSYMLYQKIQELSGYTQGDYGFNGSFTGNSFADLLLGYAGSYSELQIQNTVDLSAHTLTFYGLDNWKVADRLTLSFGVRWEYLPHVFEVNNRLSNFDPADYNLADKPIFNANGSLDPNGPGFRTVDVPEAIPNTPFYLNGVVLAGRNGTPKGLVDNRYNNFAPRVGFAYSLTNDDKTVLRGGLGMFYNRINAGDSIRMGPNPPFSYTPSTSNVYFSNPATSNVTGLTAVEPRFPASFTALNPSYPIPTSMQYSLGIQRQLSALAVLGVTYAGDKNYNQSYASNINAVPLSDPNRLAICGGNCGYKGPTYNPNLDRNYPGFSTIIDQSTGTSSIYNSLQVSLLIHARKGLNFSGAYTYSHSIDSGSNDLGLVSDPYNIGYDRGNSDFDRKHIAQFSYYYALPFFRNTSSFLTKTVLGGWQVSGITTAETGQPVSALLGYDNTGLGGATTSRANVVGPVKYPKTVQHWFSYSSFAAPPPLVFGDSARNLLYGPGLFNWNIALFKVFPLGGRGAQFEFRGETFNTFNHTQFQGVNHTFSNGPNLFGEVTSVYDPRVIQLGGALTF